MKKKLIILFVLVVVMLAPLTVSAESADVAPANTRLSFSEISMNKPLAKLWTIIPSVSGISLG